MRILDFHTDLLGSLNENRLKAVREKFDYLDYEHKKSITMQNLVKYYQPKSKISHPNKNIERLSEPEYFIAILNFYNTYIDNQKDFINLS